MDKEGFILDYMGILMLKGISIPTEIKDIILTEDISQTSHIRKRYQHSVLRNAWKHILFENGEGESDKGRFLRKCVLDLNLDLMESRERKGNKSLSILMESNKVNKSGKDIFLDQLH